MPILTPALVLLLAGAAARPAVGQSETRLEACDTPQGRRFDFWAGTWTVESSLRTGPDAWHDTTLTWKAEPVLDGCGFIDFAEGDAGDGWFSGMGSRFYDPAADEWIITWISTQNPGVLGIWRGRFDGAEGRFVRTSETPQGSVQTRIRWFNTTADSSDWEYAVSSDGATWRPMWKMRLVKVKADGRARGR